MTRTLAYPLHVDPIPCVRMSILDPFAHAFPITTADHRIVVRNVLQIPNAHRAWLVSMKNAVTPALVLAAGTQNVEWYPILLNAIVPPVMRVTPTQDVIKSFPVSMTYSPST